MRTLEDQVMTDRFSGSLSLLAFMQVPVYIFLKKVIKDLYEYFILCHLCRILSYMEIGTHLKKSHAFSINLRDRHKSNHACNVECPIVRVIA